MKAAGGSNKSFIEMIREWWGDGMMGGWGDGVIGKPADCAISGVIGALKLALASKLPYQGANWRVKKFCNDFPFFGLFPPFLTSILLQKRANLSRIFQD